MMLAKRIVSLLCACTLLVGCNRTPPVSPEANSTSGGEESLLAPLVEEALTELPLVEAPTVERNTSTTARRYRVTLGMPAPASGLLLNDEAEAYVFAESEAFEARCRVAITSQRDRDAVRLSLEVGELRLQMNSDRERFRIILDGRDREIQRLMSLNETLSGSASDFPLEEVLLGIGALAVGLVGGFAVGFLYNP